jgi:hypothetical protein
MDKDCFDARLWTWALGGGSYASTLQMQCMTFNNMTFLMYYILHFSRVLAVVCVWVAWKVARADYLSGRTALHFAAHDGLVRCVRLLLVDFVPSVSLEEITSSVVDGGDSRANNGGSPNSSLGQKLNRMYCQWIIAYSLKPFATNTMLVLVLM